MKALLSRVPGGPETLELTDLGDPVPGPGEVLVKVAACAINFPDTLIIRDLYQVKPPRPFAPGAEITGIVEQVGEGVTACKPGDRVLALTIWGGLAEKVVVPLHYLFPLPGDLPMDQACTLLMTYATVIHGLKDRGRLQPGETLLVLGAAGGVGMATVELGKALGARVVAAVSSEEKADAVRAAGADLVVIYPRASLGKDQSKALAEQFKQACGPNGADVVCDIIGGDYSEPALRAIAWEGRFLVVGFTAGIAKLPLNLTLLKGCDVAGVFWGEFVRRSPDRNREHVAELFRLWQKDGINPRAGKTYPLAHAAEAIGELEQRKAIGKLVVTMDA
jgi:NADPH:quinone reductase-like Zn-dependent oxidoreductase